MVAKLSDVAELAELAQLPFHVSLTIRDIYRKKQNKKFMKL